MQLHGAPHFCMSCTTQKPYECYYIVGGASADHKYGDILAHDLEHTEARRERAYRPPDAQMVSGMSLRLLALSTLMAALTACGSISAQQAAAPTQTARVEVVTRLIVVTATPPPATPTDATTATPRSTSTPVPSPTPDGIDAHLTRAASAHSAPDEAYVKVADFKAGDTVRVLHRGGAWFEVESGASHGWLYKDWIDLSAEAGAAVAQYPDALPVFVGKVVQQALGSSTVFKGRIFNVGATPTTGVKVEIETKDGNGERVDLASALADPYDIAAGDTASFQVITLMPYSTFIPNIEWDN